MKINKITWFEKQLQHKTGVETLKLSNASDEYLLTMEKVFVLEYYDAAEPESCNVLADSENLYCTNIAQGQHYRLQVNGKIVLFKITTRKIWFFDSVAAMIAAVVKQTN